MEKNTIKLINGLKYTISNEPTTIFIATWDDERKTYIKAGVAK